MADLASVLQTTVWTDLSLTGPNSPAVDFTLTWSPDDSQFRGLGVRVPAPSTIERTSWSLHAIQEHSD